MEIYGDRQSGNCLKVKYTADLLGIDYTWHAIDILRGETRTTEFFNVNPHGQVPVVVLQDGRSLSQSNAIMSYLAEGTWLLPDDRFARAKVMQWLFWEQYSHEPYIAVCRFHMHYLRQTKETRDQSRVERGEAALDALNNELAQSKWVGSDRFSVADIALFAYTHLGHEGGFDVASRVNVQRWLQDCREVLPDVDV